MYALIDLLTLTGAVDAWLNSLPGGPDGPRRIQRFQRIGYAAVDVTPAEFRAAQDRKFSIEVVRELRPPHITVTGRQVLAVDFLRAVPALWNLDQIGRSELVATGKTIKVGHIDTGIEPKHPVLEGHPAKFCTFMQNGDTVEINEKAAPFDEADHGTSTASLICGKPLGVAPAVQLHSAALLGRPWTDAMLVAAIDWLMGHQVRVVWFGVERPFEFCDLHEEQMKRLLAAQILPVTAVGNKGKDTSSTPGNTVGGLSVGAVCKGPREPTLWDWSGSQEHPKADALRPDVVAPGHQVYVATFYRGSEKYEYEVAEASGTSLAGPHLVGLAALCLELKPALKVEKLAEILRTACKLYNLDRKRANRGVPWGKDIKNALP